MRGEEARRFEGRRGGNGCQAASCRGYGRTGVRTCFVCMSEGNLRKRFVLRRPRCFRGGCPVRIEGGGYEWTGRRCSDEESAVGDRGRTGGKPARAAAGAQPLGGGLGGEERRGEARRGRQSNVARREEQNWDLGKREMLNDRVEKLKGPARPPLPSPHQLH